MNRPSHPLELLAPAKNADFGIEAVKHGADAVYIGGPSFGARYGAGNSLGEIERLAAFAHRYHSRVYVALNTILLDEELEPARQLAWNLYEAGVDALIVQDMAMLQMDLPPIQLHASTQTDNRTLEKVKFLQDVGFSQVVLARELSLSEIERIARNTRVALEYFVHGALCVAYSGQCFISHAHTGRSANRGECSQACRLPYTLVDEKGKVIAEDQHLLSMKDNNQTDNLIALIDAGVTSFKIEGRLKDLSYVKNITAHYRTELDRVLEQRPELSRLSTGKSTYRFTPQPDKTFNRGYTDYFAGGRQDDIGAFDSPAFVGEIIGEVSDVDADRFSVATEQTFHNGDGVCFYDSHGELAGMRINRADGPTLYPAEMHPELTVGTTLFRNRDQDFERALEKESAERRIAVDITFSETPDGFRLALCDEDGITVAVDLPHAKEVARDAQRARQTLNEQLGKLGNTDFIARHIDLGPAAPCFLPVSALNALRRQAVDALERQRLARHPRPQRDPAVDGLIHFPLEELTYLGNVLNREARAFYEKHGVRLIADAYEAGQEKGQVSLMITRHCLRYSFNLCPKEVKNVKSDPMTLMNGNEKLILKFDCKACEMHVIGKMKKGVRLQLGAARPLDKA